MPTSTSQEERACPHKLMSPAKPRALQETVKLIQRRQKKLRLRIKYGRY